MLCNERGLALVTVLFLLALLLLMALTLSDKVIHATRTAVSAGARDQALQAAGAGVEQARHLLASTYRSSSGWTTYLAGAPGSERYPETPALHTSIGRVDVDIFLRDNPDGDADPRHDNDLQLFILTRARAGEGSEILVESLCALDQAAAWYRQGGEDAQRSGQSLNDGPDQPWTAPIISFQLRD
jgi:hypothetical protein